MSTLSNITKCGGLYLCVFKLVIDRTGRGGAQEVVVEARGRLSEMKRYFGTAKLTNLIADKTRRLEHKRRNECMGINGRQPHTPIGDEGQLGFRHNPWRSRLAILEDLLETKYKEG